MLEVKGRSLLNAENQLVMDDAEKAEMFNAFNLHKKVNYQMTNVVNVKHERG